jgi:hypothetical protein
MNYTYINNTMRLNILIYIILYNYVRRMHELPYLHSMQLLKLFSNIQ